MENHSQNGTQLFLILFCCSETLKNQKAIVKVLQDIGYDDDIPILIQFLNQDENELKRIIVRTIANINPEGLNQIQALPESNQYPLNEIIKQIKGELI